MIRLDESISNHHHNQNQNQKHIMMDKDRSSFSVMKFKSNVPRPLVVKFIEDMPDIPLQNYPNYRIIQIQNDAHRFGSLSGQNPNNENATLVVKPLNTYADIYKSFRSIGPHAIVDKPVSSKDWNYRQSDEWETDVCKPMGEWQTRQYPSCNSLHEIPNGNLNQAGDVRLLSNGWWRDVWEVFGPLGDKSVLKVYCNSRSDLHEDMITENGMYFFLNF